MEFCEDDNKKLNESKKSNNEGHFFLLGFNSEGEDNTSVKVMDNPKKYKKFC